MDSGCADIFDIIALLVFPAGCPDHDRRVLRGGSWINNPENARAANRNRNNPDNRDNNRGFRVVLSAHISPAIHIAAACRPRFTARKDGRKNGTGASGPHVCRRAYTKRECSLTSGPEHSHLFFQPPCRSGPCPRSLADTVVPDSPADPSIAPMGCFYNDRQLVTLTIFSISLNLSSSVGAGHARDI